MRRKLDEPSELVTFVAYALATTDLETLVRVADSRWTIEVALEEVKGEAGSCTSGRIAGRLCY